MIVLITGASGSGKSEYGENLAVSLNQNNIKKENMIYIATMYPKGEETLKKIKRHQDMRKNKNFDTIECFCDLDKTDIEQIKGKTVLLECMSNLLANEMFGNDFLKRDVSETVKKIEKGFDILSKCSKNIIIISNEIFSDGINYDKEMIQYIQALAVINSYIAAKADKVIEVVYSIPIIQKGENYVI